MGGWIFWVIFAPVAGVVAIIPFGVVPSCVGVCIWLAAKKKKRAQAARVAASNVTNPTSKRCGCVGHCAGPGQTEDRRDDCHSRGGSADVGGGGERTTREHLPRIVRIPACVWATCISDYT